MAKFDFDKKLKWISDEKSRKAVIQLLINIHDFFLCLVRDSVGGMKEFTVVTLNGFLYNS